MPGLLINIDVPDLAAGEAFYTRAFGLRAGRRMGDDFLELLGLEAPLYLLKKDKGTQPTPESADRRSYARHWSPIHPDIAVDDLDEATERVLAAGAKLEVPACDAEYGRIAMFADPFGHGFCLIQFNAEGYDAIAD
jgi:predicted enzyme related to lactoylglutathione lyase